MTLAPLSLQQPMLPLVGVGQPDEHTRARPTFAEFFAGIGLVRLGLRPDWKPVWANDIDERKFEIYAQNFKDKHFRLDDIRGVKGREIPACDLWTASFPCNDLSIAGAMSGLNGDHSGMFWQLTRLVEEKGHDKPSMILLENVPGFLMSHGGRDFGSAIKKLNDLGYTCDAFMLNASHWVPQSRLRMFVLATSAGDGKVAPGKAEVEPSAVRPKPLAAFMSSHKLGWNVRDLPNPPTRRKTLNAVLEDLPDDDKHWWSRERCVYFLNQLSERHRVVADAMIAGETYTYGTAFRRVRNEKSMAELRSDGIAGCLRTPRGGSGRQILFKAGKGRYQVRLLTARECARLQGVPDSFKVDVPLNQALFGFGDAVCVPVIKWISKHYLLPVLTAAQ